MNDSFPLNIKFTTEVIIVMYPRVFLMDFQEFDYSYQIDPEVVCRQLTSTAMLKQFRISDCPWPVMDSWKPGSLAWRWC